MNTIKRDNIKILITGADSYIGNSFDQWCSKYHKDYSIKTISMLDDLWRKELFTNYDVVIHIAGIAHIRENKSNRELYYRVNRDLSNEVARKARDEGVGHFIFLSTMSVYGKNSGVIDSETIPCPRNNYGKSKLQAEKLITSLETEGFRVAILRPPMVYGKSCKGNYPRLAKLALMLPLFPSIHNQRSMIFIDNLCEFIDLLIRNQSRGIFFPQNPDYGCTSLIVKQIAEVHAKRIRLIALFNPLIYLFRFGVLNKLFGNLIYDKALSVYEGYNPIPTGESIVLSEKEII